MQTTTASFDSDAGRIAGRVVADHGSAYLVQLETGLVSARPTGRLKREATSQAALPVVGDWVVVERTNADAAMIHAVVDRRTALSRKHADEVTDEQVIAANIDRIFAVASLSEDLNRRRLERLLTIAWNSGASPVILLTKTDLAVDADTTQMEVETIAPSVPVLRVSAITGEGVDAVRLELAGGLTGVLIGPSGVGKSTLINRLLGGEVLTTQGLRRDGKGRHTTTHRQLFALPGGGYLIDTPGLREIQLWADPSALDQTFEDIVRLAADCRFRDCRHEREPGCAVHAAITRSDLQPDRLSAYRKLQRELHALAVRTNIHLRHEERKKWQAIHKAARQRTRPG